MKVLKIFCVLVVVAMALWLSTHVGLAAPYKLLVPFSKTIQEFSSPGEYIKTLYQFALGFGTLLAMLMIVIGAVQYTLSEAVTKKEDAKDRITGAIMGLALLLTATLILYTINPKIPELEDPGVAPIPPPGKLSPGGSSLPGASAGPGGPVGPPLPPSDCGNGIIDAGEQCETSSQCGGGFVCEECQCEEI